MSKERLEEIKNDSVDASYTAYGDGGRDTYRVEKIELFTEDYEWLIEQAEKAERYENAIKECIERMKEGGPGTRSFVYEILKKALEESE